jgi:prolyl-tRNA editing enzyme YbaK/EbsC (Cys-tRNA(Pro) deacylase)
MGMQDDFNELNSIEKIKERLRLRPQENFLPGLEEFVTHLIAQGDHHVKEASYLITTREAGKMAHRMIHESKTMVYSLPDCSLLLYILELSKRVDEEKLGKIYFSGSAIVKATPEDLADLGMNPGACHPFPQANCHKQWKIVVDEHSELRHPIYTRDFRKAGYIYVPMDNYVLLMNSRFSGRVSAENISK